MVPPIIQHTTLSLARSPANSFRHGCLVTQRLHGMARVGARFGYGFPLAFKESRKNVSVGLFQNYSPRLSLGLAKKLLSKFFADGNCPLNISMQFSRQICHILP